MGDAPNKEIKENTATNQERNRKKEIQIKEHMRKSPDKQKQHQQTEGTYNNIGIVEPYKYWFRYIF